MAKEAKTKKKVSPWKILGETLKFVGCPPVAIGDWISEAADKKAAQKEVSDAKVTEKSKKIEEAKELKSEGESIEAIANDINLESVEVKKNESNEA